MQMTHHSWGYSHQNGMDLCMGELILIRTFTFVSQNYINMFTHSIAGPRVDVKTFLYEETSNAESGQLYIEITSVIQALTGAYNI